MWIFYIIALLPALIGLLLYVFNKEVIWREWLGCVAISFVIAGLAHFIVFNVMTHDTETWSGCVTDAVYMPKWHYYYIETHTTTDADGNTTIYIDTHSGYRGPDWWVETTLGQIDTTESKWNEIKSNFGSVVFSKPGYRPDYDSGDKNDYHTKNTTDYIEPVNTTKGFRNMFKASQNVLSFVKVPKDVKVYDYPKNPSSFVSGRLVGNAINRINIKEWDQMNARIGATKKVNVILVEFQDKDEIYGQYQEAKWLGGKKNDLITTYGTYRDKVTWVYTFGWTEKNIVKQNLNTLLLQKDINNKIIPEIEKEVIKNYQIKNWKKFDYLTIYPPISSLIIMIISLIVFQVGYWYWAMTNEFNK